MDGKRMIFGTLLFVCVITTSTATDPVISKTAIEMPDFGDVSLTTTAARSSRNTPSGPEVETFTYTEGQNASFSCSLEEAQNRPDPDLRVVQLWFNGANNNLIMDESNRTSDRIFTRRRFPVSSTEPGNKSSYYRTLEMRNIRISDSGNYSCKTNKYDNAEGERYGSVPSLLSRVILLSVNAAKQVTTSKPPTPLSSVDNSQLPRRLIASLKVTTSISSTSDDSATPMRESNNILATTKSAIPLKAVNKDASNVFASTSQAGELEHGLATGATSTTSGFTVPDVEPKMLTKRSQVDKGSAVPTSPNSVQSSTSNLRQGRLITMQPATKQSFSTTTAAGRLAMPTIAKSRTDAVFPQTSSRSDVIVAKSDKPASTRLSTSPIFAVDSKKSSVEYPTSSNSSFTFSKVTTPYSATVRTTATTPSKTTMKTTAVESADEPVTGVPLSDDLSGAEIDGEEVMGGDSAGLVIGVVMAAIVTSLCAGLVLCRMRSRRRKSKYIAFGNPSYNRENVLPAGSELSIDQSLSLSSNGYTVLA